MRTSLRANVCRCQYVCQMMSTWDHRKLTGWTNISKGVCVFSLHLCLLWEPILSISPSEWGLCGQFSRQGVVLCVRNVYNQRRVLMLKIEVQGWVCVCVLCFSLASTFVYLDSMWLCMCPPSRHPHERTSPYPSQALNYSCCDCRFAYADEPSWQIWMHCSDADGDQWWPCLCFRN